MRRKDSIIVLWVKFEGDKHSMTVYVNQRENVTMISKDNCFATTAVIHTFFFGGGKGVKLSFCL